MAATTSLIVVSYNKRPYTELCLRGQLACTPPAGQIIVVDNGSTDGSLEVFDEELEVDSETSGVEFVLIRNASNLGACTARNQGLEVARGDYVAFMDNDVVVRHRDWLARLRAVLDEDEKVGICGPKLLFPFPPYDIECAGAAISRNGRVQYRGRGQAAAAPEWSRAVEVQCLISACWLMKKSVVDEVGSLDEIYNPAQFEDFDFCYRAREHGWRVLYEPTAEMYHFESVTTDGSADVIYKYVTIKNWQTFKGRWRHMFEKEDGPPDEECQWQPLRTRPLEQTYVPPMI